MLKSDDVQTVENLPEQEIQSQPPERAVADGNEESTKPVDSQVNDKMPPKSDAAAAATTAPSTPVPASSTPQNLHLSPGAASTSSSSSSSSNTGYTRQTNPRPRSHKTSPGNGPVTTSGGSSPVVSSLPPSAITAAPYVPTSVVQQPVGDYSQAGHMHTLPPTYLQHPVHMPQGYTYMQPGQVQPCPESGPPPTGVPPPPINAVGPTPWMTHYYPAPMHYDASIPTFVHHVTPPTPSATSVTTVASSACGPINSNSGTNSTNAKPSTSCMSPAPTVGSYTSTNPSTGSPMGPPGSCCGSPALQQGPPQQYVVSYHLQQGEVISLQLGDGQVEVIQGPATIRMVSTNSTPPVPLPMQVPPGHMVQQIIDQNGTLQHVILSLDPMSSHQAPPPPPGTGTFVPTPMTPYSSGSTNAPPQPMGATPIPTSAPATRFPNKQYGPPPVAPVLSHAGASSGTHTPTPSSHGPSPTPPSGGGQWLSSQSTHPPGYPVGDRRARDPTHERLIKKTRERHLKQTGHHQQQQHFSPVTPPISPAKRGARENFRNGNNGVGTSGKASTSQGSGRPENRQHDDSEESGVGHEEEEEMQQLLLELLSNIKTPKVSEIAARSALLKWGPPVREPGDAKFEPVDHIQDIMFRYEVLLSDKGKDGSYRSIFTGHSIECRLTDLRPCTEYHIRIHALYDTLKGGASDTVSFVTDSCEPDKPLPPKMIAKTKSSINLKWTSPPDNGASISHFILEFDDGMGKFHNQQPQMYTDDQGYIRDYYPRNSHEEHDKVFVTVFKGRAKCFNVTKLKASTFYRFRLVAVNELGRSLPSEAVTFSTQGSPPQQPQPPGLKEATKSSLHLVWTKRPFDSEFSLHMDDQISGHGFLPVYTGSDVQHITTGLRRNASYKFRLQSVNEEGKSPWSEEVSFFTLPDVPGPPLRPASKGRIHPHSFKVRWDPPCDDGGSVIENYILEIDGGQGWQTCYQGSNTECLCDRLVPGTQYKVRVACTSSGGVSNYSDICHICTEPVCPGQCAPPRPHGKPKSTSIHLKWGWPESDGGSPVTEFEIEMTSPDKKTLPVYKGRDTDCVVASLLPGRQYLFQVRASNRVGFGPWSEPLEVVSGAGAPDQPKAPKVVPRSPTSVRVEWNSPSNNGATILEYILQMALVSTRKCLSPPPTPIVVDEIDSESSRRPSLSSDSDYSDDDQDMTDKQNGELESQDSDDETDNGETFSTQKSQRRKKKLGQRKPAEDSESENENTNDVTDDVIVREKKVEAAKLDTSKQEFVSKQPLQETRSLEFVQLYCGTSLSYDARNLDPATTYLFRVCAANSAGESEWSETTELITQAAPPSQVSGLTLKHATANSLTFSWLRPQSNGEVITGYNVDTGSAVVGTCGAETEFTLNGLKPDMGYVIRVQAVNVIGAGPFCPGVRFHTRPLPPAPPRCECLNANFNSLKLKWGEGSKHTSGDLCQYILEMENSRNQFQVIYSGTGVTYKVSKLIENRVYRFRISAANEAGQGPFSPVYEFKTSFAYPMPIKAAPRVSAISEDGCLVDWSSAKLAPSQSGLHFTVQLSKLRETDGKVIYSGNDTQFRVNGLDPKTEYALRVNCVRVPQPGTELQGQFSPPAIFSTSSNDSGNATSVSKQQLSMKAGLTSNKNDKTWTDTQYALIILFGFAIFAIIVALIIQQIIA